MISVARVALALVVDGGRFGLMHEGVPWGGPMCPHLMATANRAVGNSSRAPCLEVHGSLTIAAVSAIDVATERGERISLAPGETFEVASDPALRVRYLALRGGACAPRMLGSASTLLGVIGERVKAGDRIASAEAASADADADADAGADADADADAGADAGADADADADPGASFPIVPGPDLDAFGDDALGALTHQALVVSRESNRVGTRLVGSPIARKTADLGDSRPMVTGAIQVPASGAPVVLGPDHPTTGGYPVIAVVSARALSRFHATPIGARVKFRIA